MKTTLMDYAFKQQALKRAIEDSLRILRECLAYLDDIVPHLNESERQKREKIIEAIRRGESLLAGINTVGA